MSSIIVQKSINNNKSNTYECSNNINPSEIQLIIEIYR